MAYVCRHNNIVDTDQPCPSCDNEYAERVATYSSERCRTCGITDYQAINQDTGEVVIMCHDGGWLHDFVSFSPVE